MSDKCMHESSIVISDCTGFSLLRCTWGCNQDLIQLDLGNHNVATYTAAELAALRARVETLEAERAQLIGIAVRAVRAVLEVGFSELKPAMSSLDSYLANQLDDELWQEIDSAATEGA